MRPTARASSSCTAGAVTNVVESEAGVAPMVWAARTPKMVMKPICLRKYIDCFWGGGVGVFRLWTERMGLFAVEFWILMRKIGVDRLLKGILLMLRKER